MGNAAAPGTGEARSAIDSFVSQSTRAPDAFAYAMNSFTVRTGGDGARRAAEEEIERGVKMEAWRPRHEVETAAGTAPGGGGLDRTAHALTRL
jgi:hypothetical protein